MSSGAKVAVGVVVLCGVVAAIGWSLLSKQPVEDPSKITRAITDTKLAEPVKAAMLSEEERLAYLDKHVVIRELSIDPDTQPGEDGSVRRVRGLFRVSGSVENQGDKPVMPIKLILNPQSDTNDILGTYTEDVTHGTALKPGETRTFRFTIPEKKEYGGRFLKALR